MKRILCAFLLISTQLSAISQDTTYYWYDKNWKETDKISAEYFRKSYPDDSGRWVVNDYYINGETQMLGHCTAKDLKYRTGKHMWYYPNGTLKEVEHYTNDTLNGQSNFFFENGNMQNSLYYINGKLQGEGSYYFANGQLKSKGVYLNDNLKGIWKYYDETGKFITNQNFIDTFQTLCGFTLQFEDGNWIFLSEEIRGVKNKNVSLDVFYRTHSYSAKGKEIQFELSAGCLHDIGQSGYTSESLARILINNMELKAKKVVSYKENSIKLNGGVLYSYKKSGKLNYMYVKVKRDTALELFFTYDKKAKEQDIEDIFRIISKVSY